MPATAGPYGLIPVGLTGGRVFNQGMRLMKIASGYNTNIFTGDLVKLVASGTIERETADAATTVIGVFMGCSYTDSTFGFIQRAYWPAGTVANDAYGYVCDDPDALFKIQADGTLGQDAIGANAGFAGDANGSTATGRSGVVLQASSVATTATLPLRIVDFWDPGEVGAAYPDMIVRWNAGHQYNNTTGV